MYQRQYIAHIKESVIVEPGQPIVVRFAQQSWQVGFCPGSEFEKTSSDFPVRTLVCQVFGFPILGTPSLATFLGTQPSKKSLLSKMISAALPVKLGLSLLITLRWFLN